MNHDLDVDYIAQVSQKAVEWAYDGSRGALRVTSGFGCWRSLAKGVAKFLNTDVTTVTLIMTEIAEITYGEHWYGVLWALNGYSRVDAPHRDASGVVAYLGRLKKHGKI